MKEKTRRSFSQKPAPGTQSGLYSVKFAIIPVSCVYSGDRETAEKALAFARKELALPHIKVRWFVPEEVAVNQYGIKNADTFENTPNLYGTIDTEADDVIYIRYDGTTTVEKQKAVLHECYHIMQIRTGAIATSHEGLEHMAYEYQKDALQRMYAMNENDLQELYLRHMCGEDWSKK